MHTSNSKDTYIYSIIVILQSTLLITLHVGTYYYYYYEQHGFRQKASTETAAFSLLNTILLSLDKKSLAGGLFLDLRKVSDCVDHDILLSKLNCYGISGKANELMKSYITDRYQRVVLYDKFSNK